MVKIEVIVRAGSRENSVTTQNDGTICVRTTENREKGKANQAVIALLSKHFKVPKSSITILRGSTSPKKLIQIE